jgi:ubiquinone/menaquinone biosynthesis C-methylase UbiE
MQNDPYRYAAGAYDALFERFNGRLRRIGFQMFTVEMSMSVLDIGCGTGQHLALYSPSGASLFGVDTSPSMLEQASRTLGDRATLHLANAQALPLESDSMDLVLCMLALHEMDEPVRGNVIREVIRVLKPTGRFLIIDYASTKPDGTRGWLLRVGIIAAEIAAGRRHFRNYRDFKANNGVGRLCEMNDLKIEKKTDVAHGNMVVCLCEAQN